MRVLKLFSILVFFFLVGAIVAEVVAEDIFLFHWLQRKRPEVCESPSVERIAKEIDYLEGQIETYGTIVPKHPDVWGEARLTRHRHEVETEMAKDLDAFRSTLNASISRSDQSFLGAALTISAALDEGATKPDQETINNLLTQVNVPENGIERTGAGKLPRAKVVDEIGKEIGGVSLEPTVVLEQKFRYLNLLNELRRINEGDDTADAPGYSLNIVRIPVSVLPGKKTRTGFGAEITITAKPHVTHELLPATFRNLVTNDIVDMLSLPGRKLLDSPDALTTLEENLGKLRSFSVSQQDVHTKRVELEVVDGFTTKQIGELTEIEGDIKDLTEGAFTGTVVSGRTSQSTLPFPPSQIIDIFGGYVLTPLALEGAAQLKEHPVNHDRTHLGDVESLLKRELDAAFEFLAQPMAQQLWHEHCTPDLVVAIRERRRHLDENLYADLRDQIIDNHPRGYRNHITRLRHDFFDDIREHFPRAVFNSTSSLAWAIIVDSALLNARLIEDMKRVAVERNCPELQAVPHWLDFYGPNPSPEARQLFAEYVKCRWPVKVFALDPVNDEQNVADAFSMRREMQLAAAAALASGNTSAGAAFRFVRRLEMDIETIELNRKTVSFVHGPDTFGWRFYPRVQTPPTVNNFQAFTQTLVGGPDGDYLLRQRKLEPGMRELTAIVLMPSFVPHLTFDTRANWFSLTNPKHKELTMRDTLQISRTWQAIRCAMPKMCNAGCYRAQDIAWLTKSVDQIERRLPLQTSLVSIPYENTLGGFEMFNSGITDLAPSLNGFYGAPGISVKDPKIECHCDDGDKPACPKEGGLPFNGIKRYGYPDAQCTATCTGTTLFLVGKNFSVHDTKVIAGGRCVPFLLMSRQIMRVTIPPNVTRLDHDASGQNVVDVHVATPYGVSNHLLIPAVSEEQPAEEPPVPEPKGFAWSEKSAKLKAALIELIPRPGHVGGYYDIVYAGIDWTKPLEIENKTGAVAPARASIQAIVSANGKVLGHTDIFPAELDADQTKYLVKINEPGNLLENVRSIAITKLESGSDPAELVVSTYILFGGYPPEKSLNNLTIELKKYVSVPEELPAPVPAPEPAPVPAPEPAPVPAPEPAPVPAAEPAPVPAAEPALGPANRPASSGGVVPADLPTPPKPAPGSTPSSSRLRKMRLDNAHAEIRQLSFERVTHETQDQRIRRLPRTSAPTVTFLDILGLRLK